MLTQAEEVAAYLLHKQDWTSRAELVKALPHDRNYAVILGAANPRSDQRRTWAAQGLVEIRTEGRGVSYRLTKRGRDHFRYLGKAPVSGPVPATLAETRDVRDPRLFQIHWDESRESFELNLEALRKGTRVSTTEIYDDGATASYAALCTELHKDRDGIYFELAYKRELNTHLKGTDWPFGSSTFAVHREGFADWSATAVWTGEGINGPATSCLVLAPQLIDEITREWVERISRAGQQAFRDKLLRRASADRLRQGCEVSGDTAAPALEAAHIIPARLGGAAKPDNGLLLRADLHRLYDSRLLRISPDGQITVDETLMRTSYEQYRGARLQAATIQRVQDALMKRAALARDDSSL